MRPADIVVDRRAIGLEDIGAAEAARLAELVAAGLAAAVSGPDAPDIRPGRRPALEIAVTGTAGQQPAELAREIVAQLVLELARRG